MSLCVALSAALSLCVCVCLCLPLCVSVQEAPRSLRRSVALGAGIVPTDNLLVLSHREKLAKEEERQRHTAAAASAAREREREREREEEDSAQDSSDTESAAAKPHSAADGPSLDELQALGECFSFSQVVFLCWVSVFLCVCVCFNPSVCQCVSFVSVSANSLPVRPLLFLVCVSMCVSEFAFAPVPNLSVCFCRFSFPLSVVSLFPSLRPSSLCRLSVVSLSSLCCLSVVSLSSLCCLSVVSLLSFCRLSAALSLCACAALRVCLSVCLCLTFCMCVFVCCQRLLRRRQSPINPRLSLETWEKRAASLQRVQ